MFLPMMLEKITVPAIPSITVAVRHRDSDVHVLWVQFAFPATVGQGSCDLPQQHFARSRHCWDPQISWFTVEHPMKKWDDI